MEDMTSRQHSWYIKPKNISQGTEVLGKQKECRQLGKRRGTRKRSTETGSGGSVCSTGDGQTHSHIYVPNAIVKLISLYAN